MRVVDDLFVDSHKAAIMHSGRRNYDLVGRVSMKSPWKSNRVFQYRRREFHYADIGMTDGPPKPFRQPNRERNSVALNQLG